MSIPEETMEKEIKLLNKLKQIAEEYICLKEDYQNNPVLNKSNELLKEIKIRLSHFCQHDIVEDVIETKIDTCETLYYCWKCETTFHSLSLLQ